MKKLIFSLIFYGLITSLLFAQIKSDSTKIEIRLNFLNFYNDPISEPFLLSDLDNIKLKLNLTNDSTSIWLQTRLQLSGLMNQDENKNRLQSEILNPLSQKYSSSQSMKTLKYILGTVQVSAVGYLAYLHLKKYGFLKRK